MTREEAINGWIIPAIKNTWNEKKCGEIIEALEQQPCEDDYIKVPKKAMKYVTKGMVAYNYEWLREHFDIERLVVCGEQAPCEDCISRQTVLEQINCWIGSGEYKYTNATYYLTRRMQELSPVTPQPKTGHWIMIDKELQRYKCSECGEVIRLYKKSEIPKLEKDETLSNYPFSHCGCRMVEPQESEDI